MDVDETSGAGAVVESFAVDGMEPGTRVEVEMREEGLQGARFAGVVKDVREDAALVRIEAFAEDAPEWFNWSQLRPHPPETPGGQGWCTEIQKGDHVDLLSEDAWWEMEVTLVERERITRTMSFTL